MRSANLSTLLKLYPDDLDPTDLDKMEALDIHLPCWINLQREIFSDFVEQAPYGVRWWAPHPGTKRRILISDHLFCCAASVSSNLIEAALHWLEFLHASDQDNALYRDSVTVDGGLAVYSPPRPRNAFEQLTPDFIRIHEAGLARALSSALDCLGAVVIGVAALPTSILRAGLNDARRELKRVAAKKGMWHPQQVELAERFEKAVIDSGPMGWLNWTLDWRNMLVHRGRRTEHGRIVRDTPILFDSSSKEIIRTKRLSQLPRDPGKSDVEVFRDGHDKYVLHEDAAVTLLGLKDSTRAFVETLAPHLLELWRWRRKNPSSLNQPKEQWDGGPSDESTGFDGYRQDPQLLESGERYGTIHPILHRRILAAALDDLRRAEWDNFD
jgi:hypothetical protein